MGDIFFALRARTRVLRDAIPAVHPPMRRVGVFNP